MIRTIYNAEITLNDQKTFKKHLINILEYTFYYHKQITKNEIAKLIQELNEEFK